MYYEINVSKKADSQPSDRPIHWGPLYAHFFATAARSITTRRDLRKVFPKIKQAFPEPQYKVDVTIVEEMRQPFTQVEMADILKQSKQEEKL